MKLNLEFDGVIKNDDMLAAAFSVSLPLLIRDRGGIVRASASILLRDSFDEVRLRQMIVGQANFEDTAFDINSEDFEFAGCLFDDDTSIAVREAHLLFALRCIQDCRKGRVPCLNYNG